MFTKEMVILDIVADYPETEQVFRMYDEIAEKCVMCNNLFETLEEFTTLYKINLNDLINKLDNAVKSD
ncbi:hypothetical protein K8M07_09225 [Schnuerera sp. xch1]|uniref:hypothetical protein n=1 Tax=Schnuerera sp. xch1 TaxID=2874283 RepID=UPI001CC09AC6|nr:hypothetical protein [Schnuerera sp. xch1]MBZ2175426.1 hypothetical protein [Schnuerera sp. xch1]